MTEHTFSPTVLIVDDDPAILDIARHEFYSHTSLGVVIIDNLNDARKLIDGKRFFNQPTCSRLNHITSADC